MVLCALCGMCANHDSTQSQDACEKGGRKKLVGLQICRSPSQTNGMLSVVWLVVGSYSHTSFLLGFSPQPCQETVPYEPNEVVLDESQVTPNGDDQRRGYFAGKIFSNEMQAYRCDMCSVVHDLLFLDS